MKAAQISDYGGPEVIEINDITEPQPQQDQILVEVHAAAINIFDKKLRSGYMRGVIPLEFPVTLGGDFSGIVKQVGINAPGFKPGDELFGSALILGGSTGSLAEVTAVKANKVALKPNRLSHPEAASLVLVGVSAMQALGSIKLSSGQKILIHGGAGGIGSIAIQYAKYLGAHVATTARFDDKSFVRDLGADEVIDYQNQHFEEILSDYDAVFDTIGGETYKKSFTILRSGGSIASMLESPDETLTNKYNVESIMINAKVNTESLNSLTKLLDTGAIKPQVDKEFPLDQTVDAFRYLEEGHSKGKVIVRVR